MREAASLRQQRRMKQAVQFIHKDSADLLPLDGLKKLGSSKDTVSPRGRAHLGLPARGGLSPRCAVSRGPCAAAFTESPPRPALAAVSCRRLRILSGQQPRFRSSQDSVVAFLARAAFRSASSLRVYLLSSRRDPALPPGP